MLLAGLAIAGAVLAQTASRPGGNMEYWLGQSATATASAPAGGATASAAAGAPGQGISGGRSPDSEPASRDDALPGALLLSDGRLLPGRLLTTRDRDWEVWVEAEQRWRHIPPVAVLSISAQVIEQGMDKEWRWKEMGSDERVFTGRERPIRRFLWRFRLIDGSVVTGAVKGQPLWVESGGQRHGPFVLQERSAGQFGQGLDELVYLQKAVISVRAAALERTAAD